MSRIQMRRGTAQQWTEANPVLSVGEPGYETDTTVLRIGDGVTAWLSLDPISDPLLLQLAQQARDAALAAAESAQDAIDNFTSGSGFVVDSDLTDPTRDNNVTLRALIADVAGDVGGVSTWAELAGKPATFPPSVHTHDDRYFTETETTAALAGKAPTVHTHTAAQVSDATAIGRELMKAATTTAARTAVGLVEGTPAEGQYQLVDADTLVGGSTIAAAYDSFATKGTAALPALSDSGDTWRQVAGVATLSIIDGMLTNAGAAAGGSAGYAELALTNNVTRLGAELTLTAGTGGTGGSATMAILSQSIVDSWPSIPAMAMHFSVSRTGWTYGLWPTNGAAGQVVLATGSFDAPLDPAKWYAVEVVLDGDTAHLLLPDGSTTSVTEPRIATLAGRFAFWEVYQANASTDAKARYRRVWADDAPNQAYSSSAVMRAVQAARNMVWRPRTGAISVGASANTGSTASSTPTELADSATPAVSPRVPMSSSAWLVVPPSGKVKVTMTAIVNQTGAGQYFWDMQVVDFASGAQLRKDSVEASASTGRRWTTVEKEMSGLTPGMRVQFRWLHWITTGAAGVVVASGLGIHATMTVTPVAA